MDTTRLDHLLDAFLHDLLTDAEAKELNALLDGDEQARRRFAIASDQHQAIGDHYRGSATVAALGISTSAHKPRRMNRAKVIRPRRAWLSVAAPLAAGVLIAFGVTMSLREHDRAASTSSLPVVAFLSGADAAIVRGGERLPLRADVRIDEADRIITAKGTRFSFRYADGSEVQVDERTVLTIGSEAKAKRIELSSGALFISAAKQPPESPWVIRTPTSTATIIGTTFEIAVDSDQTRLSVVEGRVRLTNDHGESVVDGGSTCLARSGAAPGQPTALAAAEFAAWRGGGASRAVVTKPDAVSGTFARGTFPGAGNWEIINPVKYALDFTADGVTYRFSPRKRGIAQLISKIPIALERGKVLHIRGTFTGNSGGLIARVSLFDADDTSHGTYAHLQLKIGYNEILLATCTSDASKNLPNEKVVRKLSAGRWKKLRPGSFMSDIDLAITAATARLTVDGIAQPESEHSLPLRKVRLALAGQYLEPIVPPGIELSTSGLAVSVEDE
jgi:hypothetical protein